MTLAPCDSGKKYKKCCLVAEQRAAAAARLLSTMSTPKERKECATLERFGMTSPPEIGGQPGDYEDRCTQWFLEQSFFRDFVYRNPKPKKGKELADALVLFNDVALLVQVKTQCGNHEPLAWATEKLLEAHKQINETRQQLLAGVTKLTHELYGSHPFDPAKHPSHIGLIILAQDRARPFDATIQVPELLTSGFPIHVFSLRDFQMLAERCDTAADLVTYLEFRSEVMLREKCFVHSEEANIDHVIAYIPEFLERHMSPAAPAEFAKTVAATVETISGRLLSSPEYRFGLAIDDIIARAHDIESTDEARRRKNLPVAEFLGWLSRIRRIILGRRLIELCQNAQDGEAHYFPHIQEARGTGCVYLASSLDRPTRLKFLQTLVAYASVKYAVPRWLGVATEPIGPGSSYDFVLLHGPLPDEEVERLKTLDDPFRANDPLIMLPE